MLSALSEEESQRGEGKGKEKGMKLQFAYLSALCCWLVPLVHRRSPSRSTHSLSIARSLARR